MLYSVLNNQGTVLFNNDKFSIIKMEKCSDEQISWNSLKNATAVSTYALSNFFGPRFPDILVLSKKGDREFNNDTIVEIDQEAVISADPDLQKILLTIKSLKGRAETLKISPYFYFCIINSGTPDKGTLENKDLGVFTDFEIKGENFEVKIDEELNKRDAFGVFFINEFESIFIPLADEAGFNRMLAKVKTRSQLDGRIASSYLVFPSWEAHRTRVKVKDISNMKTEEMLTFFSHHKKSGTKVETLSGCLQALNRRHVKDNDRGVGEISLIQVSTFGTGSCEIDIPPVDWVLCHAAYFECVYTEVVDQYNQNIFIRKLSEPKDDFAQVLYTTWEQTKRNIQLAFISAGNLEKVFSAVSNKKDQTERAAAF